MSSREYGKEPAQTINSGRLMPNNKVAEDAFKANVVLFLEKVVELNNLLDKEEDTELVELKIQELNYIVSEIEKIVPRSDKGEMV